MSNNNNTNNSSLVMDIGQGLSVILGLSRIAYWNTSERPKNPKQGAFGFNIQSNSLEYFNGSYWLQAKLKRI